MPDKVTLRRARRDASEGKAPSTQAGEFVREEIHHVREGKHGARSAKQAIAIGLSKARKAGVALPPRPGAKPAAHDGQKRARSSEPSPNGRITITPSPRSAAAGRIVDSMLRSSGL